MQNITSALRARGSKLGYLQRLQAARRTEGGVPPPAALHVDVYGVSGEGF